MNNGFLKFNVFHLNSESFLNKSKGNILNKDDLVGLIYENKKMSIILNTNFMLATFKT